MKLKINLSNKVYDILCKVTTWINPIGAFYLTISLIWNLPYGEEVSKTCIALTTLMMAILGISSATYYKDKVEE